jgi:hypothetical protein
MILDNDMKLPEEITLQYRFTKKDIGILQIIDGMKPYFENIPYEILYEYINKISICKNNFNYLPSKYKFIRIKKSGYVYPVSIYKDCLWLPESYINRPARKVEPEDEIRLNPHLAPPFTFIQTIREKIKTLYYIKRFQLKKWLQK